MAMLNRHGLVDRELVPPQVRAAFGTLIDTAVRDVSVILDDAIKRASEIMRDRDLSPDGKVWKRQSLNAGSNEKFDEVTKRRAALEQAERKAREGLPTSSRSSDRPTTARRTKRCFERSGRRWP